MYSEYCSELCSEALLSDTDYIDKKNIESFTVNPTNFSEDINSINLSELMIQPYFAPETT